MKVADLIAVLSRFNPEDEVIISRDVEEYGFGYIDRVVPGVFLMTDYGNDFDSSSHIVTSQTQARAICLFPEKVEEPTPSSDSPSQ